MKSLKNLELADLLSSLVNQVSADYEYNSAAARQLAPIADTVEHSSYSKEREKEED